MSPPDTTYLAHVADEVDGTPRTHELGEHLRKVAVSAAARAAHFDAAEWAHMAGQWHDLGKYRPGFQRYIRDCADAHIEGKVPSKDKTHSAAGALHAIRHLSVNHGEVGKLSARVLAYLIAGHHAGLADWHGNLKGRLAAQDAETEYAEALENAPPELLECSTPLELRDAVPGGITTPCAFALWVRMLFSSLVDADFLDTEAFMDAGKVGSRGNFPTLAVMREAYDRHMAGFVADTPVRQIRADILRQCRTRARGGPGLYSLTVPTGGGKTLASLGFALDHALEHNKRRIVYAIPYTSIIEQTADVFRRVFQSLEQDCVIEHHSQADSDPADETSASRLACENWDAPLVVTTNVQLFESLFAARTSRCRKLHNLTRSVLILDEAQQLPPEFLQPILDTLRLLVQHYGVTIVLCTATQPALASTKYFDANRNLRGLDDATEIIEDPDALYAALNRVSVQLPADFTTPTPWADLAEQLVMHDCVLAIVNTRVSARELHRLMPSDTLHLSALMCGAHRSDVLARVRMRLAARRDGSDNAPLRIISTQLVEAGVDLDLPVVYRALTGLDSIAQAAGRCNREGLLTEGGKVYIFIPPAATPPGTLRKAADACRSVLHGIEGDPLDRGLFEHYFRQFYANVDLDKQGIVPLLQPEANRDSRLAVNFRTAADRFQLIEDIQAPVIVLYRGPNGQDRTVDAVLGRLAKDGPERWLMRALQRYTVSIPQPLAARLHVRGDLRLVMPGLYAQSSDILYDSVLGLRDDQTLPPPDRLVV